MRGFSLPCWRTRGCSKLMNMEETFFIEKKAKRILFALMFIVMALIAILIYWENAHMVTGPNLVLQEAKAKSFYGKIASIYHDKSNHDVMVLVLSNGYQYRVYPVWEPLVDIGDSLSKDDGSLQVKVFKKNGGTYTLDYKKLVAGLK